MARIFLVVWCAVFLATGASAQDYPAKQVNVIVPYTPGSATDVIGRLVCEKLSSLWGQPVVVENRAGAGGTVGAGEVAKAPADGYTLLVSSASLAASPALYQKLPYDPDKAFADIAPLARQPYALVVGPAAGAKSLAELIAALKAKPGRLKFGSAGVGSGAHLVAEKFKMAAGIDVAHAPYKGGPEANADTAAGVVVFWFPPVAMALKDVKEGKLLALGVTSAQRSNVLPQVPTMAEAGVAGVEDVNWWGLWAPAGTPAGVKEKLAKDAATALAAPEVREKLAKMGAEPMHMSADEFSRFVRAERESATRVVKAAGIKPQQ